MVTALTLPFVDPTNIGDRWEIVSTGYFLKSTCQCLLCSSHVHQLYQLLNYLSSFNTLQDEVPLKLLTKTSVNPWTLLSPEVTEQFKDDLLSQVVAHESTLLSSGQRQRS